MNLARKIELIGNVYHASVGIASTDGFTSEESVAVSRLGEPIIAVGGNFANVGLSTDFDLPDRDLRFPSQFPAEAIFSREDVANANDRAQTFDAEIVTRVTAAITALLVVNVGVLKDEVTNH